MTDINDDWELFLLNGNIDDIIDDNVVDNNTFINSNINIPKFTEINISTQTKLIKINKEINIQKLFWDIKIMPYELPDNGIIKKQMRFNSLCHEDMNNISEKLKNITNYTEQIITNIDNPNGRIKFKNVKKITIGLCKKDIILYKTKQKKVFNNCFSLIIRIKINDVFNEYHVKIFKTGKIELLGITTELVFNTLIEYLLYLLTKYLNTTNDNEPIKLINEPETILINSNFSSNFYIDRFELYNILKCKYNIRSSFNSCKYPGIHCVLYYNINTGEKIINGQIDKHNKNISKVTFMVFRTGKILIVGKCNKDILDNTYKYIIDILTQEYNNIFISINENIIKEKKQKIRKKYITS
jgi:hypothetical protein